MHAVSTLIITYKYHSNVEFTYLLSNLAFINNVAR